VKIHLLIGLKLTGNGEGTGQIATRDRDDCGRSRLLGGTFTIETSNDQEESCQQKAEKPRDPKDSPTMHGATLLSIPQVRNWNRRQYICLKGLAITNVLFDV
jgi:hypothetical protein